MNTKTANDASRKALEQALGKPIRHCQWLQYRKEILDSGLSLNKQTCNAYGKFKQLRPRSRLTKQTIDYFLSFNENYSATTSFYGIEIKDKVLEVNKDLKQPTFYKNFFTATQKRFKPNEKYSFEEFSRVLLCCLSIESHKYHPRKEK